MINPVVDELRRLFLAILMMCMTAITLIDLLAIFGGRSFGIQILAGMNFPYMAVATVCLWRRMFAYE